MSLRDIAEADLGIIVEDDVNGFGYPINITNPDGVKLPFVCLSNDIGQAIDPDTGQIVSGRFVSVAIRISTLTSVGFDLPYGVADSSVKPWVVEIDGVNFKVVNSDPDQTIGLLVCTLELYK